MDATQQVVAIIASVLGILALAGGWWYKFGRPMAATSEAILGRPEIKDRSGAVLQEAQPGMPAQVAQLAVDVREALDVVTRVGRLEVDVAAMRQDVEGLKDARIERVVTQAESAQMWTAIAAVNENQPED